MSMVRTYATTFEIIAENSQDAEDILKNNEERFSKELEQCNVIEEYYQCDGEEDLELENDLQDIAIRVTNKLIELGYVKDCTDTDSYDEYEVQDAIAEILNDSLKK